MADMQVINDSMDNLITAATSINTSLDTVQAAQTRIAAAVTTLNGKVVSGGDE